MTSASLPAGAAPISVAGYLLPNGEDNPYSSKDEKLRGQAEQRLAQLERAVAEAPASQPLQSTQDRGDMVRVPAGNFLYGDENRRVHLPEFWIDRTEVTVTAYGECVRAGGCSEPDTGGSCNWGVSGRGDHPVNCVDWNEAKSYCEWAGNRLPTEEEWEKAARGTDGRKYPWGDEEATCALAVMDEDGNGCGRDRTWPVGSKPSGASPYDALDMAGNVWEWTSSWKRELLLFKVRVLRGGSWGVGPRGTRASYRGGWFPPGRDDFVGIRCAQ